MPRTRPIGPSDTHSAAPQQPSTCRLGHITPSHMDLPGYPARCRCYSSRYIPQKLLSQQTVFIGSLKSSMHMGHVKRGLRGAAKSIPDTRRALRSASISVAKCYQEVARRLVVVRCLFSRSLFLRFGKRDCLKLCRRRMQDRVVRPSAYSTSSPSKFEDAME